MEKIKCNQACECIHNLLQSKSWEVHAARELLSSNVLRAFERGRHNPHHLQEPQEHTNAWLEVQATTVMTGCCCAVFFQDLWQGSVTYCYGLMFLCHHLVGSFFSIICSL